MTPFALSAIKYAILALLYLFIWRALRSTVKGVREGAPAGRGGGRRGEGADARPAPPELSTVIVHGPDGSKPRTFRLAASMAIGRDPSCEIRVDDTYASHQHARIFGKNGHWYVEDLGSTNGTFVNDQRLGAPAQVEAGDRIRVGTTELELRR
jgi:pSer/pThr/pTyr-binding forkhead associated (FHA) protein